MALPPAQSDPLPIRSTDDAADDRWSPRDWQQAAERALAALATQWATTEGSGRNRTLLVGCLRQGPPLARDFCLDLDWLADTAWAYVSDSVWEPNRPTHPSGHHRWLGDCR